MNTLSLSNSLTSFEQSSKYYLGYPHNMKWNYSELAEFNNYHINNIGSPYKQGYSKMTSKDYEQEVLQFWAEKYNLDTDNIGGYISSSGTESNMWGIYLAKRNCDKCVLVTSSETHYSFKKIADMLSIPLVSIASQAHGEINYDALKNSLGTIPHDTKVIINVNIGTTVKGAYDNLDKILSTIDDLGITNYHIHVDCALSGGFLPFINDINKPDIGFHKRIHSLALSGHKFIGLPTSAGICLADKRLVSAFSDNGTYVGSDDTTIMGSRNGHAAMQLWYAQTTRDFAQEIIECFEKTIHFSAALQNNDIQHLINPYSITVVIPKPSDEIVGKYQLACKDQMAHVVVMQHVSKDILDEFIEDLKKDNTEEKQLILS